MILLAIKSECFINRSFGFQLSTLIWFFSFVFHLFLEFISLCLLTFYNAISCIYISTFKLALNYKVNDLLCTRIDFLKRKTLRVGCIFASIVSHSTSLLLPLRNGSSKMATALKYKSESSLLACPVDEPSKFHMGKSATLHLLCFYLYLCTYSLVL